MAPQGGMVISKLAIQATASDEEVKGLLCLKISLPKETETRQATRWALFTSSPPKLTAPPSIYPLPLNRQGSRSLASAARLLGLLYSQSTPQKPSKGGVTPYLDVSSVNGQVYVVLDGSSGRKRRDSNSTPGGSSTPSKADRREYLIVLEFRYDIGSHPDGPSSVTLSLPKCLDNVIRFQIANEDEGEVSIMTEPKLLPLPPGAFASAPPTRCTPHGQGHGLRTDEEGWEDGKDLSEEEGASGSDEDTEVDGGGSWLEGRFQSTDSLRLEWSFAPTASSSSSAPYLQITPVYDQLKPRIHISYEAPLIDCDTLETYLPTGWGYTSLTTSAPGLRGWDCVDGDTWSDGRLSSSIPMPTTPDAKVEGSRSFEVEDSFATIRGPRKYPAALSRGSPTPPRHESKASLLRQTIPDMKVEDFSFEMNDDSMFSDTTTAVSKTPNYKTSPSQSQEVPGIVLNKPIAGRLFELDFGPGGARAEGALRLEAVLAPLSKMVLIAPGVPVQLPRVQYGDAEETLTVCPNAMCGESTTSDAIYQGGVSTAYFHWADRNGKIIPPSPAAISGDVQVRINSSHWAQTMFIEIPCPSKAGDFLCLTILRPVENIKVVRATCQGRTLPRTILDVDKAAQLFFGVSRGARESIKISLEIRNVGEGEVVLPHVQGKPGRMLVHLPSSFSNFKLCSKSNFKAIDHLSYAYDLSSPSPPTLAFLPPSQTTAVSPKRSWGIFSWNTLINLFMLWLLLSMGQQVQRLRTEIAWVADEARDLRMYHELAQRTPQYPPPFGSSSSPPRVSPDVTSAQGQSTQPGAWSKMDEVQIRDENRSADVSTALGRVVFGRSGWDKFSSHPTVRTLSKGLGWLWHTVVWLVVPPT